MLSRKTSLNHILDKIKGQRVIIRADFNVPIKNGVITNNNRIVSTLPTIQKIIDE
jgi:phosphoglycerate kinase